MNNNERGVWLKLIRWRRMAWIIHTEKVQTWERISPGAWIISCTPKSWKGEGTAALVGGGTLIQSWISIFEVWWHAWAVWEGWWHPKNSEPLWYPAAEICWNEKWLDTGMTRGEKKDGLWLHKPLFHRCVKIAPRKQRPKSKNVPTPRAGSDLPLTWGICVCVGFKSEWLNRQGMCQMPMSAMKSPEPISWSLWETFAMTDPEMKWEYRVWDLKMFLFYCCFDQSVLEGEAAWAAEIH